MIYKDLMGRMVEGEVWCQGPKDKTLWVLRPNRTAAVVNPTKAEEIEYAAPQYITPLPASAKVMAEEIVQRYQDARKLLAPILRNVTPIGPEHTLAVEVLKHVTASEKSRKPFLDAHGGRLPVSDKRLRDLAKEEIEP